MKIKGFFAKNIRKFRRKNEANLLSFSPQVVAGRNDYIVGQLKKATSIFNQYDNNIALEGDYGTGKSSILRQLKQSPVWRLLNRPKTISFFAFSEKRSVSNIKMQSEIVRQLYFGENASKLKGSSYRRIGKHYYRISISIAIIFGIFIIPVLLGTNFPTIIGNIGVFLDAKNGIDIIGAINILTWVSAVALIAILVNIILNLLANATIKNISAKDLSVELLDKKPDFDQLIDLLVFYFKSTKRRVIIFEDLDRFNKPKIFEELRQLNFILNNRLKLFGKIKFIYATRDDLFNKSTSTEAGIENIRTKVFDLIIPVVPFLAEINYGSVFQNEYNKAGFKYNVAGIEKVLSRHSSDMRVIKAIINDMMVYDKTFELESEADYKNCAALSIIRMFEPGEFKKLSTGNSSLDTILAECYKQKRNELNEIENKYAANSKIKTYSNDIWTAIKTYGEANPANYQLQNVLIDGNTYTATDYNTLIKLFNAKSNIQINWTTYNKHKILTPVQIKEIFSKFTLNTPEELQNKEQELRNVAEQNSFDFYSQIKEELAKDSSIPTIIVELIENGFVTEDYLRFTAKSASNDNTTNNAKRYIFKYIRGEKRDIEYSINPETAKAILNEIDNTDLKSTGLYNYDLFDYIIKNKTKYHNHLEQLILNAKADLDKFLDFFDSYCHKYKHELENESCTGLNESTIDRLSKTIPPAFLTMKLAKYYPKELIKKVTWSSLGDTNAKEVIYDIVAISLEKPSEIVLDESDRSFLGYYADTIIKNENGKGNLFRLNVANNIPIDNLDIYGITNEEINHYLEKIIIVLNERNINYLEEDTLIEYIKTKQLNSDDFSVIMKSDKEKAKQYIVRKIEKVIAEDSLSKCLQRAAMYVYEKKIPLTADELLQYAGKTNTENLVGIIIIPDLTKEEIVMVMSNCNDKNLSKIQIKNSIIILKSNKQSEILAKKLESLSLVKRQNSHKNKKIIRLQVL